MVLAVQVYSNNMNYVQRAQNGCKVGIPVINFCQYDIQTCQK